MVPKTDKRFTDRELAGARRRFAKSGLSMQAFANRHDTTLAAVRDVLRGRNAGRVGDGFRAAVALGLREGAE